MKPRHQELLTKLTDQADENIEKFLEEYKEIGKEVQLALREELQPPVNKLLRNITNYRYYNAKEIVTSQDSIYQQLDNLLWKIEKSISTILFEDDSIEETVNKKTYNKSNIESPPHNILYQLSIYNAALVSWKVKRSILTIQQALHDRSIDENTYQTLQKLTENENTEIIDSLYEYFVDDSGQRLDTETLTLAEIIDII